MEKEGWSLLSTNMHEVGSNRERGMVTAIFQVCNGFLVLEGSSTP